jgi:hypothetical protein
MSPLEAVPEAIFRLCAMSRSSIGTAARWSRESVPSPAIHEIVPRGQGALLYRCRTLGPFWHVARGLTFYRVDYPVRNEPGMMAKDPSGFATMLATGPARADAASLRFA